MWLWNQLKEISKIKLTNGTVKEIMCILVVKFNSKILYRCFLNAYSTRTQFWSVSALSLFKLSSIRIRITNINIARKPHFLICIHGHPSLAFIALPNLHICMLILFFNIIIEYNFEINKDIQAHWWIFYNTSI